MMKAVVVEINKNHVAVLSENGSITTIKNDNYEIGQTIQINTEKGLFVKRFATFAASAAALLILGTGTWAYASPYTYVSLDVNPSIEFTVNRFDRVIKVKAVNDDGFDLMEDTTIKELTNSTIKKAISETVDQISEAGYFTGEEEGGIVIATSSKSSEKAIKLAKELETTVEDETANHGDEVTVEVFPVEKERLQEAQNLGVTPGKLNLVEKLIESSEDPSSMNKEEWLKKPVKDIMKATKDNNKPDKTEVELGEPIGETVTQVPEIDSKQNNINSDSADKDNSADKAEKEAEKAIEKADKAEQKAEKAKEKAQEAKEKAEKTAKEAKEADAAKKREADAKAKEAEIEAKQTKEDAKEAAKAAEEAKRDAEKAKKDAEKVKKDNDKTKKDNDKSKSDDKNSEKDNKKSDTTSDKKKDNVVTTDQDTSSDSNDNTKNQNSNSENKPIKNDNHDISDNDTDTDLDKETINNDTTSDNSEQKPGNNSDKGKVSNSEDASDTD